MLPSASVMPHSPSFSLFVLVTLSLYSQFLAQALFSLYHLFLDDLSHSHGFKSYLYSDDSQIFLAQIF